MNEDLADPPDNIPSWCVRVPPPTCGQINYAQPDLNDEGESIDTQDILQGETGVSTMLCTTKSCRPMYPFSRSTWSPKHIQQLTWYTVSPMSQTIGTTAAYRMDGHEVLPA